MAKPMISGLFGPQASKPESKAQLTNAAFRSIVTAEAAKREAKTARLRLAREKMEAENPAPEPAPKKRATKAKAAK